MDVIRIKGGQRISGAVRVSGAKNAALPMFAATLLTDEPCIIRNVPKLRDIRFMAEILSYLGAEVEELEPGTWRICARAIDSVAPYELVRQMRASICLLGPLVGRLRQAKISLPGGCVIGPRPIDLHLKALSAMGCAVVVDSGYVHVEASGLRGDYIYLGGRQGPTVTGTANVVMAAALAKGITRMESAACEPEVVDLCRMLEQMGAQIEGIGSHYLKITGVERLHGCDYSIIPDRIEAGTYLTAGIVTESRVKVEGVITGHMRALLAKLEEAEIPCDVDPEAGSITVHGDIARRKPVEIITLPHPGFPTDLQAQMCACMALTPGLSIITERIYPNRFMHVPELLRMGADISMEGASAVIKGRGHLSGAPVMASDLRASAALVLAGLAARGETWIQRVYHLDRGYDAMVDKLAGLGAQVERLKDSDMPSSLRGEEI